MKLKWYAEAMRKIQWRDFIAKRFFFILHNIPFSSFFMGCHSIMKISFVTLRSKTETKKWARKRKREKEKKWIKNMNVTARVEHFLSSSFVAFRCIRISFLRNYFYHICHIFRRKTHFTLANWKKRNEFCRLWVTTHTHQHQYQYFVGKNLGQAAAYHIVTLFYFICHCCKFQNALPSLSRFETAIQLSLPFVVALRFLFLLDG